MHYLFKFYCYYRFSLGQGKLINLPRSRMIPKDRHTNISFKTKWVRFVNVVEKRRYFPEESLTGERKVE